MHTLLFFRFCFVFVHRLKNKTKLLSFAERNNLKTKGAKHCFRFSQKKNSFSKFNSFNFEVENKILFKHNYAPKWLI